MRTTPGPRKGQSNPFAPGARAGAERRPVLCLAAVLASAALVPVTPALADEAERLGRLYEHLHRNPELSFQEKNTARRLGDEWKAAGFSVTRGVGGHGVVGVLKNGDGPTVMLRTDLDALPVAEQTGLPYASRATATDDTGKKVSVMHACGHDIHMTVLAGAARRLAQKRAEWSGTLVLVGQPAEERGSGAVAMLRDGLFERFPRPDYNLALHTSAELPAGAVGYVPGYALASVDSVDVTLFGVGGHGAYPHRTRDPVVLAAQVITALQTLVSREIEPVEAGVVTVGSIHGGSKHNIISERVDLQLTVRAYSDDTRRTLLDGIARIARGQALAMGLPEDRLPVVKVTESTPSTYNDPALTARLVPVFARVLGADHVREVKPVMGGEDFSEYGRVEPRIPGVIYWLGGVDPERHRIAQAGGPALPSLHSPFFAPAAKPAIAAGVDTLTAAALELLKKP